ncbi:MAG: class I SAM-dependent methyltransferase [Proteobacteria bacterium]|nr:class I SAM-dependent methyltransferase [Pseudomonadota bacterium]
MTTDNKDFNAAAATWDEKPERVKLAGEVAEAIIRQVAPNRTMKAADFGCGTGLVSLKLQPLVAFITGIDSSSGMLDILKAKIAEGKLPNIDTRLLDVEKGETLTGEYDLITSSMTLHHMREPEALLRQLNAVLAPGGILAIADLDPDDGLFHEDNTGVHHRGFDRSALRAMFAEAGFSDIRDSTATEIIKSAPDGTKKVFSVFLVSGRNVRS